MHLTIYRNNQEVATINVGETATFTSVLMGEHKITASCFTATPLAVAIGDYIMHNNEKYYLNLVPTVEKLNNITYSYQFVFEASVYSLFNKKMMDEGAIDFSYTGTAEDHLLLLVQNMNSIDTGWSIAAVAETGIQTLTYVKESCRQALTTMAEAFGLEFRLVGKAIYLLETVATDTTLTFEYGQGNGLYSLLRKAVDDANVVTRVYGFGGTRNLSFDYRNGLKNLVFEERYLEANTDIFGVKEGYFEDLEIYPSRQSTVTDVDAEDNTKIIDTSIDFNINTQLLEGVTAEIHFLTGALTGYTFEISNYNHTTKTINFIPFTENNGYILPNDVNFPEIGDEYTLLGIKMPQSYIDAKETELKAKTTQFLAENSFPTVTYELSIDEKYIQDNNIELQVGNRVTIVDAALAVNTKIRVHKITYPLVKPNRITATISDKIVYTVQEQLIKATVTTTKNTTNVRRESVENARRNALNNRKLQDLVFDADDFFDTENIRPLSINTAMLSVGAKSQNFGLNEVVIQPNYNADENAIEISAGALVHYEIEIDGLGFVWQIDPLSTDTLVATTAYYLYAKCSKTALTGTWLLSANPIKAEEVTGFYHFNLGVLYAVADGRRDFDFTKGMTFITGDTITTGRLQSLDELNFIDLSQNKMHFGDAESYLDWNNLEAGKLKISKAVVDQSLMANNLWAEDATIGNWRIKGNEIVSQDGGVNPTIELNSLVGEMRVNDASGRVSKIDKEGILSNAAMKQVLPSSSAIVAKASVAGLGFGDVAADFLNRNFVAGIFGRAENANTNPAPAFGGYFLGLYASGLHLRVNNITETTTLTYYDVVVHCYQTAAIIVNLEPNPIVGKYVEITNINNIPCTVDGNGNSLIYKGTRTSVAMKYGNTLVFVWDGSYWSYSERI